MPATESHLTAEDRFHEIATILAAGLLRLRTRPEAPPCTAKSRSGKSPESRRNVLDGGAQIEPS